ncbi:MAG: class I SAM-dependent methyltransferase [Gemmatimonadaceae bacterium]
MKADWNRVVEEWLANHPHPAWRQHSDRVNSDLVERWLPAKSGCLLKTDLFDEVASDGIYPLLATRADKICGMDVSLYTATAARRKYPEVGACAADIRGLPFANSSFDAIVSLSTVDHFADPADIEVSLKELWRVMRPGGTLVITVDNRSNPLIALRNSLPYSFLRKLGLVSYPVGRTLTFRGAYKTVELAGFAVCDCIGILLAPRVLAIPLVELAARHGTRRMRDGITNCLMWMERLQQNPVAPRLAHFVAIRATKPVGAFA